MANTFKFKRGLETNRTGETPAAGEPLWTTDDQELWIGDGSTAGGVALTIREANISDLGSYTNAATAETISAQWTFGAGLLTDTIGEETAAAGVTIDGVLLKDGEVTTDTINEDTTTAGVTVDQMWIKDGGIHRNFTAAENLSAGDLCYLNSSNKMAKADADAASTSTNMLGLSTGVAAADSTQEFVLYGGLNEFGSLTIGAPVYVSTTAGGVTQTAPTGTGDIVRIIGYAISATEIYLDPDKTWVELA